MLERIKSIISDFEPRNLTVRDAMVGLAVIALMIICSGGAIVISILSSRKNNLPTPIPSPTSEPAPTPIFQSLEALPTSTSPAPTVAPTMAPTVAPTIIYENVNAPTRPAGESCKYSEAWINLVATPIPDGGFSKYQGYLCENGYWVIGIGDWVNSAGDWGEDGSMEKALIKFNGEGVEIDRMFVDLNGNRIPGPNK
jgi:hypothetical protein